MPLLGHRRNVSALTGKRSTEELQISPQSLSPQLPRRTTEFENSLPLLNAHNEGSRSANSRFRTQQGKYWTEVIYGTKETLLKALCDQSWAKPPISTKKENPTTLRNMTDRLLSNRALLTEANPYVDEFISTFHYFMTPTQLLDYLFSTYGKVTNSLSETEDKREFESLKEQKNK